MEISLTWQCPKCELYQNKLFRFPNNYLITEPDIQKKKKKGRYTCRRCGNVWNFTKLEHYKTTINPNDAKNYVKELNLKNLI